VAASIRASTKAASRGIQGLEVVICIFAIIIVRTSSNGYLP
jgi:hypothetical protein